MSDGEFICVLLRERCPFELIEFGLAALPRLSIQWVLGGCNQVDLLQAPCSTAKSDSRCSSFSRFEASRD